MFFSDCNSLERIIYARNPCYLTVYATSYILLLLETEWVRPDNLRDKLKKAIVSKDVSTLQSVIEMAEQASLPEVSSDLRKARDTLESLGGGRGG